MVDYLQSSPCRLSNETGRDTERKPPRLNVKNGINTPPPYRAILSRARTHGTCGGFNDGKASAPLFCWRVPHSNPSPAGPTRGLPDAIQTVANVRYGAKTCWNQQQHTTTMTARCIYDTVWLMSGRAWRGVWGREKKTCGCPYHIHFHTNALPCLSAQNGVDTNMLSLVFRTAV